MSKTLPDAVEDLSERIADLHAHLQMLEGQMRACIRRFDAIRSSPVVALQEGLDHAFLLMNSGRTDAAPMNANRGDHASAEASRIVGRPKLKPLAVALALDQQGSHRSGLRRG